MKGNVDRQKCSVEELKKAIAAIPNDNLGVPIQGCKCAVLHPNNFVSTSLIPNDLQAESKTNLIFLYFKVLHKIPHFI